MSASERLRAAVHEAAHALIHMLDGYTPATVLLREDLTGECQHDPRLDFESRTAIALFVAGDVGERVVFGSARGWGEADRANAKRFAEQLYYPGAPSSDYRRGFAVNGIVVQAECDVANRLSRHRGALLAIARELDLRGELSGDDVRRIAGLRSAA